MSCPSEKFLVAYCVELVFYLAWGVMSIAEHHSISAILIKPFQGRFHTINPIGWQLRL